MCADPVQQGAFDAKVAALAPNLVSGPMYSLYGKLTQAEALAGPVTVAELPPHSHLFGALIFIDSGAAGGVGPGTVTLTVQLAPEVDDPTNVLLLNGADMTVQGGSWNFVEDGLTTSTPWCILTDIDTDTNDDIGVGVACNLQVLVEETGTGSITATENSYIHVILVAADMTPQSGGAAGTLLEAIVDVLTAKFPDVADQLTAAVAALPS